jgi:uncharacterized protein
MMWSDLFAAFALYLVLEGILPFLNPPAMRRAMQAFLGMEDNKLRAMGLMSMVAGAILLYFVRH